MYTVAIAQYGRDRLPASPMYRAASAARKVLTENVQAWRSSSSEGLFIRSQGVSVPAAAQHQEQVDLVT